MTITRQLITKGAKTITYTEIEITCGNVIKDAVEENCVYDNY